MADETQAQVSAPAQAPFDPIAEARKRWPGLKDWSDEGILQSLSDPRRFRQAFPEYGNLDNHTIVYNMAQIIPHGPPAPTVQMEEQGLGETLADAISEAAPKQALPAGTSPLRYPASPALPADFPKEAATSYVQSLGEMAKGAGFVSPLRYPKPEQLPPLPEVHSAEEAAKGAASIATGLNVGEIQKAAEEQNIGKLVGRIAAPLTVLAAGAKLVKEAAGRGAVPGETPSPEIPTAAEAFNGEVPISETVPAEPRPGPGAKNANIGKETGSDLAQLADSLQAMTSPKADPVQRVAAGQIIANQVSAGKSAVGATFDKLKATTAALWDSYARPAEWTDFKNSLGKWQGAIQKSDFDARNFADAIKKAIPDTTKREAVVNYVQAGGDAAELAKWADEAAPTYKPGYQAAKTLSPDEQVFARNVRHYFDAKLDEAIKADILEQGVTDYVNQLWKKENPVGRGLVTEAELGKLSTNPSFAKRRIFGSYFEGEKQGFKPVKKDIGFLLSVYDQSLNRAIAGRAFVRSLFSGRASDGRPLVAVSEATAQPIPRTEGAPTEAYLVRPGLKPEEMADFRFLDHPALRRWRWAGKDDQSRPIFVRGTALVHPEVFQHLKNVLGTSALREFAPTRALLKAGQTVKGTMLDLSGFHQVQEGLHGIGHNVNPFKLPEINLENKTQMALVEHGLQIANFRASEAFSEGSTSGSLIRKIPGIGKAAQYCNDYLFQNYIPRLKMKMALDALERNTKRYSKKLSRDQIMEMTAQQSNSAFGELNYSMMGRSKTLQDVFRLAALAPDFLEARARFVGQALKPYGREQLFALSRLAAEMYVAARVANYAMSGDPHYDKPFSLVYKGTEYRLRSIPGDIQHAITDPRNFVYVRLNPAVAKPGIEAITGRDEFGRPRSFLDQFSDQVKTIVPISLQKRIKNPTDYSVVDSLLQSTGVSSTRYKTAAEKLAADYAFAQIPLNADPKAARQRAQLVRRYAKELAEGKISFSDLKAMVKRGQVTGDMARAIAKPDSGMQRDFARLPLEKALDVWDVAQPDERKALRPLLVKKVVNLDPAAHTPAQFRALKAAARQRLKGK